MRAINVSAGDHGNDKFAQLLFVHQGDPPRCELASLQDGCDFDRIEAQRQDRFSQPCPITEERLDCTQGELFDFVGFPTP